ncbi:hypothetical protein [Nitrosomonas marina]|uniref:Helix-turn-helix n=1 Tax=Nitrosomonas marina TaxID=917 RepID=A0A1H8IQE2_9PROT|nr:hypothetical protein [Nitrosomonas marina]SEN71120.1 hypothetical protein SAMN05216325_1399 [Nitrosomonas marina]
MELITGAQIRMARGYLRWSIKDLSNKAAIGTTTIKRMESANGVPDIKTSILQKIRLTFEDQGIIFIPQNGAGPGVRLKNPLEADQV